MNAEQEKREYVLNAIASYPSQAQAAIALGTSPKVVSHWNTNKSQPRELAVRVIQLLDVLKQAGIEAPPPLKFESF
ncbi:hypothetical protein LC605_31665 [Nostoc sp. CHAB 5836]|uniref:hypothetical protein n=1 Tax=Nostoc sp. CHAB 5836 TaxID=2780404 RepID=UPI001E418149|nr:hypothetical protein [Nostoc sp. CHAB 5836]MCC5619528.1 hypothetical protein [Nostoc sp. CHAB 5836]